jgi:hypothetical protein
MTLLVSELVTNAMLHGGTSSELTVRIDEGVLRAEVRDGNSSLPHVKHYSETATTGRGLLIVQALSAAWGTTPEGAGKVVWFELNATRAPGGSNPWESTRTGWAQGYPPGDTSEVFYLEGDRWDDDLPKGVLVSVVGVGC